MANETNTCRKYVEPKLSDAGWQTEPHDYTEQYYFTAGRIQPRSRKQRGERKFTDYLLLYDGNFPIAVVEAKAKYKTADEGLEQAINYARILDVKFAYATNGVGIVEYDFTTGKQSDELVQFPSPAELWQRLTGEEPQQLRADIAQKLLMPFYPTPGKDLRYYQRNAVNAAISGVLRGQNRLLLTMATGTGKTTTAFQICWKLSQMRWNTTGETRTPRILFLADRNVLIDDPMIRDFAVFGADKIYKIQGEATKGRDIHFAIYQAIAEDLLRPGLYREYSPNYFDLIIIDECHRGSARDEGSWRKILEYFEPAYQLGLTATPQRDDNIDTYRYFGNPLYTYTLKQGIEDGFLAPYRVYRVTTRSDADGWRPNQGQLDRLGRTVPDFVYQTPDFERKLVRSARTRAIAQHLTDFLKSTDRSAKTIVFCVDEEHVKAMIKELRNLNTDITKKNPNYISRITSDAGEVGKGHLYQFKDILNETHIVAVTSKLLMTGVDIPTCKNVVLAKVIRSMTDFKQMIGRGTRVQEDRGKISFNIIDYTNSTVLFEDPDFDGEPAFINLTEIDDLGKIITQTESAETIADDPADLNGFRGLPTTANELSSKYYVDGGSDEIIRETIYDLNGNYGLQVARIINTTKDRILTLYRSQLEIQQRWIDPQARTEIIDLLGDAGIEFDELRQATNKPDADPFDLICHVAFDAPVLTHKQRAENLRRRQPDLFQQYGDEARAVLEILLNKYAQTGIDEFNLPDAFKANPELLKYGNVAEIAEHFGGVTQLRLAIQQLQVQLYSA